MAFLLHKLLTESAERNPAKLAVVGPGGSLSYEQLERLSNQIARQLREGGVRPGDRVGLFLNKRVEGVAAFWASRKLAPLMCQLIPTRRPSAPPIFWATVPFARSLAHPIRSPGCQRSF